MHNSRRRTSGLPRLIPAALIALTLVPLVAAAQETAERVRKRGQINVGYREDAAPFSLLDANKQPVGYSLDFCKPLVQKLATATGNGNLRVRYIAVPVDEVTRMVKSHGVDLMCSGTSDTAERRESMAFSQPIFVASTRVLVPAKSPAKSAVELGGKTLVVIDKTTAEAAAKNYATQKGILWQVAKAINPEAAIGQLKLGWAMGYVRDDVLLAAQLASLPQVQAQDYRMLPDALSTENIAIAFASGDKQLQTMANEVIGTMIQTGEARRSYERWFMKAADTGARPLNLPMSPEVKTLLQVP